ncbi:hypothetical protein [Shewanella donghaensis]|uniref:hypothetical protein n=1 Tax=Shewanella donghaensis TaxID=238836 RepID=UPI00118428B4|nr:hypothetical protein [Shewanella donghaensis]
MKNINTQQQKLSELIDSLPKEISPKNDLWQNIDDQISAQTSSEPNLNKHANQHGWRNLAIAASVGFVMVLGWMLSTGSAQNPTLAPVTAAMNDTLTNRSTEDLVALVDQIAATHQQQINTFDDNKYTVGMQLNDLSNPFSKGYTELQLASKEIQKALKNDPNNKQVWDLWLWVMKREIELLQQQQRTPNNTTPSTQGNTI